MEEGEGALGHNRMYVYERVLGFRVWGLGFLGFRDLGGLEGRALGFGV